MAVTTFASGTQTTTAATEHTLTANPETTAGVYQFYLDLNALTAGTTLIARLKEKVISGGTERIFWYDLLTGLMGDEKIWVSPSFMLINGWDFSVECSASSLSIPWSIRTL